MAVRTTEDKLREEYFALLPDVRRVIQEVEAQVRYVSTADVRQIA